MRKTGAREKKWWAISKAGARMKAREQWEEIKIALER